MEILNIEDFIASTKAELDLNSQTLDRIELARKKTLERRKDILLTYQAKANALYNASIVDSTPLIDSAITKLSEEFEDGDNALTLISLRNIPSSQRIFVRRNKTREFQEQSKAYFFQRYISEEVKQGNAIVLTKNTSSHSYILLPYPNISETNQKYNADLANFDKFPYIKSFIYKIIIWQLNNKMSITKDIIADLMAEVLTEFTFQPNQNSLDYDNYSELPF